MRAVCACLFLASVVTPGFSWTLTTTHSNVIPGLTDGVSLNCSYDGRMNGVAFFARLMRIRLLKQDNSINNGTWKMYAEIVQANSPKPILDKPDLPGVSTSGRLRQPSQSYLAVTWSSASDDTVGSYRCEIDGFTVIFEETEKKYTEVLRITNHKTSVSDFLNIIVQMKKRSDKMSQQITSMDNEHGAKRQMLEKRIMNRVEFAIEDNYFEVRYWPSGAYTLLTDAYGCPSTPFSNLVEGYMKVQSETKVPPHHVFPPRFNYTQCTNCGTRNVLPFDFCTNNRAEPRLLWPKGSYCIMQMASGSSCTTGFTYGYTTLYLNSLVNLIVTKENISYPITFTASSKVLYLIFCCRNDGAVGTPILLPNAKPFYLYRFGGTCQSVYNMDVTNLQIQIDTDDTKTDSYSNNFHADGTINNGGLELCYYTKKQRVP